MVRFDAKSLDLDDEEDDIESNIEEDQVAVVARSGEFVERSNKGLIGLITRSVL